MIFRHSWTPKGQPWRWRLDVIPYDANMNDTDIRSFATTAVDAPLRAYDALAQAFKDVPIGLQEPASWGFTLAWETLRSEFQDYLRTRTDGTGRNVFLLYSDRGTSGGTYTLEFAGVQPVLGGSKWTRESYGLGYRVDLVDVVYGTLSTMTGTQLTTALVTYLPGNKYPVLWEVNHGAVNRSDAYQSARYEHTKFTSGFELSTFAYFWTSIAAAMGTTVAPTINRRGSALPSAWLDTTAQLKKMANTVVRFYAASSTGYPRTVGSMLDEDTTCLITRVYTPSGEVVGGRWSDADEFGIGRYDSVWDWMRDFIECMSAKVSYVVSVNAGGGNPYLEITWRVLPCFASAASHFNDTDTAVDISEITEIDPVVIGRAEVRARYISQGNTTDYVENSGVVRTDRSYTVRMEQVNNLPSVLPDTRGSNDVDASTKRYIDNVSNGVVETNLVCSLVSNTPQRCHEKVRIYYTSSDYIEVDHAISGTMPSNVTSAQKEAYALWVKEVQANTGLPLCTAQMLVEALGRQTSAEVTITWRTSELGADGTLSMLGERVQLISGDITTKLPDLRWDYAFVTSVSMDIAAGTTELKLLLWGD